MSEVINKSKLAKETTGVLASLTTGQKNEALLVMADALRREAPPLSPPTRRIWNEEDLMGLRNPCSTGWL